MMLTRERPASTRVVVPAVGAFGRDVPPLDERGAVTDYDGQRPPSYAQQESRLGEQQFERVAGARLLLIDAGP